MFLRSSSTLGRRRTLEEGSTREQSLDPNDGVKTKELDLTVIIAVVIAAVGAIAVFLFWRYLKKRNTELDKQNPKKPTQQLATENNESGPARKSWMRGQANESEPESKDELARNLERQAEMKQVRSVASAVQMGMQMGLQSTNQVHTGVKSVMLKKHEETQDERNAARIWKAQPDSTTAGIEKDAEDAKVLDEKLDALALDELDVMTSNLLASAGRKSKNGPLAARHSQAGNGHFILGGWQVRSDDIETVHELGSGAFGALSLVKVRGVHMASKRLDVAASGMESVAHQRAAVRRLMVETRALAELQHPNIVRLLGVCMEEGKMCVLTEVAPRGDLRSLLDGCMHEREQDQAHGARTSMSMPLWLRLRMLRGISLAMRHAHAHLPSAIVHRDLRPSNIVVAQDWTARVNEWGLAMGAGAARSAHEHVSIAELGAGVSAYTPPEVLAVDMDSDSEPESAEEDDGDADVGAEAVEGLDCEGWSRKGDVYSFGVLAWEVLGGNAPYAGRLELGNSSSNSQSALAALELCERLCDVVVARKLRPHGWGHARAPTVAGVEGDAATAMPLLQREAEERSKARNDNINITSSDTSNDTSNDSKDGNADVESHELVAALEDSDVLKLVTRCWAAKPHYRPSFEEVSAALQAVCSERALSEIGGGWDERSWRRAMGMDEESGAGMGMDKVDAVLGMAGGKGKGEVDALMAEHARRANEVEQQALQEAEREERKQKAAGVGSSGADLTSSAAGIDLTSSFANFYKGAFVDTDADGSGDEAESGGYASSV